MNLLQTYLKTLFLSGILVQSYAQEAKPQESIINFNKKVKLTNTDTGKTVVLRIKDKTMMARPSTATPIMEATERTSTSQAVDSHVLLASTDNSYPQTVSLKDKIIKPKSDEPKVESKTTFQSNCFYNLDGQIKDQKGFGLQLAAFNQLKFAQDFAQKLIKNTAIEANKIAIQSIQDSNQVMVYRVVYGMFDKMNLAQEAQKNIEKSGIQSFIKNF